MLNKSIKESCFYENHVPVWPCPSCDEGKLKLDPSKLIHQYDAASNLDFNEVWFDYDMARGVFTAHFNCNICEESVVSSGYFQLIEEFEHDDCGQPTNSLGTIMKFEPKLFLPPLPIFSMKFNSGIPQEITDSMNKSFELFWCDLGSCINKIRTTIELILNNLNIKEKSPNGKDISLHNRIELIDPCFDDVKKILLAIKWIGNAGSHELNGVSREDVLLGFEFINFCINILYPVENNASVLLGQANAINSNKKPLSRFNI